MIAAQLLAAGLWQRFWDNPLFVNALLGGTAIAVMCSLLSVFVVLKRMAFIGEGIAHAAFGGAGVALLLGLVLEEVRPPLARDAVIAAFCVATALGIGVMSRRWRLPEDSAIGIALVAAMALGVVLLDLRSALLQQMLASGSLTRGDIGYTPSFHDILFGNILFMRPEEVGVAWVLAAVVVAAMAATFKEMVFFAFDEETAVVFGVRTSLFYYGFLVLLGLAIVATIRSMGVILASAMFILPGASGRFWSNRIGVVTILSILIGVIGVVAGLFIAVWARILSPGPVIVLTLFAGFLASYAVHPLRKRRRRGNSLD